MFIRLLLGEQSVLENGLSDCDDDDKDGESDAIDDDDDDDVDDDDDDDEEEEEEEEEEGKGEKQSNSRQNGRARKQEHLLETRVLSIAQDLVYSVSGGQRWTPKHVGLGSSLRKATRSTHLVEMFHNAGHTISYRDV